MPRGPMKRATCPYCDKESTAPAMGRHIPMCAANPANHACYKQLMTDRDDIGCTYSEYQARVVDHDAPSVTTLKRITGMIAWDDILAWFGLLPADAPANTRVCPCCGKTFAALGYARHCRACGGNAEARRVAAEVAEESRIVAWEGELLEQDAIAAQWLFVGDKRKPPIIKPAPGLRINGRECVRVVLR